MKPTYTLDDFNFDLPEDQVAQFPQENRDESRLFVLNRKNGSYSHKKFYELDELLKSGDLLVFNNARVIHARIYCKRESGGKVEIILTQRQSATRWLVLCNRTKRLQIGETIHAINKPALGLTIKERRDEFLEVEASEELSDELLAGVGEMPLPPYIKRSFSPVDEKRYQTVYASESGAVAAPTAGLHFTDTLLDRLRIKGVEVEFLTLYVSWGTFQPVREQDLSLHKMHTERYSLSGTTAERINKARAEGRRVIAVGTTSLRVLETTYEDGRNEPGYGETNIFIYPPYTVRSIDGIITNFHTPYSTLLMLVSAFAGYDTIINAYKKAVEMRYHFFSYGDAMFIQ
ncbi:MAG: tRNA preQ1(34) S-adenosylmethionine ribosyltransferase-isomerase QueA [bacterium]|nr:tRNA preQ1(34) S-adenosylmethionine ribosyltransferase-isomerase QueA [bacterium]